MSITSRTIATALIMIGAATHVQADVITYDLLDTPHGNYLDGGFYKYVGGETRYETYSFEENGADAKLAYDEDKGIVRVYGKGYNLISGELEDFNVSYNNVTRDGDSLTLQNMGDVGSFGGADTNGKGFNLTLGDTLTGHGWLTDPTSGAHFGDFHFAGVQSSASGSVPAPAPLGLLAMAGLYFTWRRKARG